MRCEFSFLFCIAESKEASLPPCLSHRIRILNFFAFLYFFLLLHLSSSFRSHFSQLFVALAVKKTTKKVKRVQTCEEQNASSAMQMQNANDVQCNAMGFDKKCGSKCDEKKKVFALPSLTSIVHVPTSLGVSNVRSPGPGRTQRQV